MRILSSFGSLMVASALALGACANPVSLGHDTGGMTNTSSSGGAGGATSTATGGSPSGTGGSVATTTTSTGGGPGAADSIAVLASAVPASVNTSAWLEPEETLDASTLVIVIDSLENAFVETCASPRFDEGMASSHEIIVFGLPVAMQAPGTYMFSSPEVIAWGSNWITDGMGNGGGGFSPLSGGSVEVVSIDASNVVFKFASLPAGYRVLEGEHTASRCP